MQLTLECEVVGLGDSDKAALDELMQRYCSSKRVAYNRLTQGEGVSQVVHILESLGSLALNWRYCEHAARDAHAEMKSQRELLPLHLTNIYDRIEETEKRLAKLRDRKAKQTKLPVLMKRLSRLNKSKIILEEHLANRTLPKVIFGTRSLFVERVRGKVTRGQWKAARNDQLYSIGQANQKGNANARFNTQCDKIGINFPHKSETRNTSKGVIRVKNERRWFSLRVPSAYGKRLSSMLGSGHAYSVRVIRRNGRYFAQVSFEIEGKAADQSAISSVASIDNNPDGFAVAVVSRDGNLIAHRFFRDDRLVYALNDKRNSIIGQLVGEIISYARKNGAGVIVTEDLRITGHRNFGKRANRVVYAFVRRKFFENLLIRAWKEVMPTFTVSPAYTSRVGDIKYRERHGLSIHEAAALCIGRRFFGHGEKLKDPLSVVVKRSAEKKSVMPVRYVWASIYGYHRPSDPYKAPPGRKGSREGRVGVGNEAVFTGRPASEGTPLIDDEGVRKGGECGGSPQATGYGGKPAPPFDDGGGKVIAASERIE